MARGNVALPCFGRTRRQNHASDGRSRFAQVGGLRLASACPAAVASRSLLVGARLPPRQPRPGWGALSCLKAVRASGNAGLLRPWNCEADRMHAWMWRAPAGGADPRLKARQQWAGFLALRSSACWRSNLRDGRAIPITASDFGPGRPAQHPTFQDVPEPGQTPRAWATLLRFRGSSW